MNISKEQAKKLHEIISLANDFVKKVSYDGNWEICTYEASENFINTKEHLGVCKVGTGEMVAVCGSANANNREQTEYDIAFIAKAPFLFKRLAEVLASHGTTVQESNFTCMGNSLDKSYQELWDKINELTELVGKKDEEIVEYKKKHEDILAVMYSALTFYTNYGENTDDVGAYGNEVGTAEGCKWEYDEGRIAKEAIRDYEKWLK